MFEHHCPLCDTVHIDDHPECFHSGLEIRRLKRANKRIAEDGGRR